MATLDGRPAFRPNQKGTQTRFDRWIQSARQGLEGVLSVVSILKMKSKYGKFFTTN
jgi:hypothetical protein